MAHYLLLIALVLQGSVISLTQPVWSGYRSQSTAVVGVDSCRRTLTVIDPSILHARDHVFLHQTMSRDPDMTGLCEFSVVDTVIGNTIYLTTKRMHPYDPSRGLQIVKVLFARSASIEGTLRCLPWNGMNGGIIAIECLDTIVIRGEIDASGVGGRGGRASLNTLDTAILGDTNVMDRSSISMGEGQGAAFGGRARNAGGAGGSLYGVGGNGGDQTSAFTRLVIGGRSDVVPASLLYNARILIGSGGGGGHQNDFNGTAGGSGGGIIIIRSPVVVADGLALLQCRGANAREAHEDGAGGGGSGGNIALLTDTIVGELSTDVSGGRGGSTRGELFHYGPGGGGGGGFVGCSSNKNLTNVSVVEAGGAAGSSVSNIDRDTSFYGARDGTSGSSGVIEDIVTGPTRRARVSLAAKDSIVPNGARTILIATGGASYRWREKMSSISVTNDTVETAEINTPMWFLVDIITSDGCTITDSVYVRPLLSSLPQLTISIDDARGAPGDTIDLYVRVRSEPSNARTITGVVWVSMRVTTLIPLRNAVRRTDTTVQMTFPFRLTSRTGSTFRRSSARAVLGDSASIVLQIDSVQLDTTVRDLRIVNGKFTLDGLCVESGRPRLFTHQAIPFTITGRTIVADANEVMLTDLLGKTINLETVRTGSQLSAIIPDVATGSFYLTLLRDGLRKTVGIVIE